MLSDILFWIGAWCVASLVVLVLFHIGKLTTRLTAAEELITDLVEAIEETDKCLGFAELSTCDDCEEKRTDALAKHTAYRERFPTDE